MYNDANEIIGLTYANMIMNHQTVFGISNFGAFGAVANFGVGYVYVSDLLRGPNRWLTLTENNTELKELSHEVALRWVPKMLLVVETVGNMWKSDPIGTLIIECMSNKTMQ